MDDIARGYRNPDNYRLAAAAAAENWKAVGGRLGALVDVCPHDGADWRGVAVRVNVERFDDAVRAALEECGEDIGNGKQPMAWDSVEVAEVRNLP